MTAGSGSCTSHDGVMQGREITGILGIQAWRMDFWKRFYTRVVCTDWLEVRCTPTNMGQGCRAALRAQAVVVTLVAGSIGGETLEMRDARGGSEQVGGRSMALSRTAGTEKTRRGGTHPSSPAGTGVD